MARTDNPILNNPYVEPTRHYATDRDGNLDYTRRIQGRSTFIPDSPIIPVGQRPQSELFDINELDSEYRSHLVNLIRKEVGAWREADYPNVTSRVTRLLLDYWFGNPDREDFQKLFFAQREAVETAIWLNEIAEKSNPGTHILNALRAAQRTAGMSPADQLPRIAFKTNFHAFQPKTLSGNKRSPFDGMCQ